MLPRPPPSTLFPYTTLFRSSEVVETLSVWPPAGGLVTPLNTSRRPWFGLTVTLLFRKQSIERARALTQLHICPGQMLYTAPLTTARPVPVGQLVVIRLSASC